MFFIFPILSRFNGYLSGYLLSRQHIEFILTIQDGDLIVPEAAQHI
jgi:hypothetical protein